MAQQNKRNSLKRRKALFGDGAIMAAAIGVQTAAQVANMVLQRNATLDAARQQANAQTQAARTQADAQTRAAQIQSQATVQSSKAATEASNKANEVQKQLAQNAQDFTKNENEQARDLQEQMQMNMQLLMGQENTKQRKENAKIVARNGSNVKRSLKVGGNTSRPFTGELDFAIKDGDKNLANPIIPLQRTNDGGVIFMVNPNLANHGESNGDGKKGVGIATGQNGYVPKQANLEVEGGEIFKAIPGQGIVSVVSKHKLPHTNFDPKDYYLATGDYNGAFIQQEYLKRKYNIADGYNGPRQHALNGMSGATQVNNELYYNQQPNLNTDTMDAAIMSIAATQNMQNALNGGNLQDGQLNTDDNSRVNVAAAKYGKNMRKSLKRCKAATGMDLYGYPAIGGGVGVGLGILGGVLGSSANNRAAEILNDALVQSSGYLIDASNNSANALAAGQNQAADALVEAGNRIYNTRIEGMSREEANRFGDALPALRTTRTSVNAPITKIDRDRDRAIRNIRRNSLSSAAAQMRELEVMDRAQQARNQVYAQQAAREDEIRNANAETINRTQSENLNRALMAQREYMNNKLQVDQFNAGNQIRGIEMIGNANAQRYSLLGDIEANRINSIAQANVNRITGMASNSANARVANAQLWGNTLQNIGNTAASTMNTIGNNISAHETAMATATPQGRGAIATKGEADGYLASMNPERMTKSQLSEAAAYFSRFPSLKSKYPDIASKLSGGQTRTS